MHKSMTELPTRLLLRVSVKLLFLFSLGIVAYTLLSSLITERGEPLAAPPLLFQVEALSDNQALRIAWAGGNLILVKRSEATLAALQSATDKLQDPLSYQASQPEGLPAHTRSLQPALFLAFDRGTDMGCPITWVAAGNREAPQQPWPGGFRDQCRGSWYDAAGRVFKAQQAGRNLDIPPYRYRGKDLLEIGLSGDNAAPAN